MLGLKPFTEYEFQISSKLHLSKGSWSNWSEPLRTQTPEEGTCQKTERGEWNGRKKGGREEDTVIPLEQSLQYWY